MECGARRGEAIGLAGECGEAEECSELIVKHVAAIYVVQLAAADGEYFTKVGITSKYDPECSTPFDGLAARARGFYPYRVTACEVRVGDVEKVRSVEAAMIRKLCGMKVVGCRNGMKYTPQVPFNGSKKECFRLAYNKMKKLLDDKWEAHDATPSGAEG